MEKNNQIFQFNNASNCGFVHLDKVAMASKNQDRPVFFASLVLR